MTETLPSLSGIPFYQEPTLYLTLAGRLWPWEFNGWKQESMSWKTGCYIHSGLSAAPLFVFDGPDVDAFFAHICTNSFAKFSADSMKHAVMCTEEGLVAQHGILQRTAGGQYSFFAAGPWPIYMLQKTKRFDVRVRAETIYLLQVAGPTSIDTLERATGESLRDLPFLRYRTVTIAGHTVELGRIGMSGNLAYEVRGPQAEGPAVYDAIFRAGADFGIERLGWRTYLANHVEGGFPQHTWTFFSAAASDPGYAAFAAGQHPGFIPAVSGSVDPADMRARYRTPLEMGWDKAVKFDHDFVGRKALEAEAAKPRRTIATLRWNANDMIDIYASLFKRGPEYKTLDLPTSPTWATGFIAHADHLLREGQPIGYSSGTIYSYFFRDVLSLACLDVEHAAIGTEVVVKWGDHGQRIKDVRATVERYPLLSEDRNDSLDVAATASEAQPA